MPSEPVRGMRSLTIPTIVGKKNAMPNAKNVAAPNAAAVLVATLRDNPVAAERLCLLLGTARTAGCLIDRLPAVLPIFGDDSALAAPLNREALIAAAQARSVVRPDQGGRVAAMHRLWGEQLITIVTADVAGLADPIDVGNRLTAAADALVEGALAAAIGDDAPLRLDRTGAGYRLQIASGPDLLDFDSADAEDAYALALLHVLESRARS